MTPKKVREILGWYTKNGVHRPIFGRRGEPKIKKQPAKIDGKVQRYIKSLPKHNGYYTEVDNVLNKDNELIAEAEERYEKLAKKNRLPEPVNESLYVDTLYSKQSYLNREKLLDYSRKVINNANEPISGIRYKGTVILTDGNHRTASAKLNSKSKIDVKVTDLDKPKRWFSRKGVK